LLYIVVALKVEAQAFVEKYKLKKEKLSSFTLFVSEEIRLIISGIGVQNAREATQTLVNNYDITDEDIYLNAGICGANKEYEIGTLIEIGSLVFEGMTYTLDSKNAELNCVNAAISTDTLKIVDMESYGFYDAVIHNPAIKHFHILKVVSDHFEPQKVQKDATKALLFKRLSAINEILFTKE